MPIQYIKKLSRFMYPWLVILLCALFLFYKYVLQVSPSVMTHDLMRFFQINGVGLGNLVAMYFYSYAIIQLIAGPLLDQYSPRKLMTAAIFLSALGTYVFATSHHLFYASIGRALIGVGAAFATVGYMKMATIYFPAKQFAFVAGLLATAAMIGALLGETPLVIIIKEYGWQHSLVGIAIVGFVISVLFYIFVRDKNSAHHKEFNPHLRLKWSDFASILKKKHNWLLAIYGGLAFEPIVAFSGLWGNPYLQEAYHLTKTGASNYISLTFLGMAVGSPILGWISDRLQNRLSVMTFGGILSCVSLIFIIYVPMPLFWVGVCLFLLGFSIGSYMLGFAIGRDWNHPAMAATVIALINTGDAILGSISDPLIGRFLDLFWTGKIKNGVYYFSISDYRYSLSILIFYVLLSMLFIYLLKRARCKIARA